MDGQTFPPLMLLGRLLRGVDLKTRESGMEYRQQDRLRGRPLTSVDSRDVCTTKYQPPDGFVIVKVNIQGSEQQLGGFNRPQPKGSHHADSSSQRENYLRISIPFEDSYRGIKALISPNTSRFY